MAALSEPGNRPRRQTLQHRLSAKGDTRFALQERQVELPHDGVWPSCSNAKCKSMRSFEMSVFTFGYHL